MGVGAGADAGVDADVGVGADFFKTHEMRELRKAVTSEVSR